MHMVVVNDDASVVHIIVVNDGALMKTGSLYHECNICVCNIKLYLCFSSKDMGEWRYCLTDS